MSRGISDAERTAERSTGRMGSMFGGLSERITGVGRSVRDMGAQWTMFATGPILAAGAGMLKFAGDAESAGARLETTFGAQTSNIRTYLEDLQEIAPASMASLENSASDAMGALTTLGLKQGESNEMTQEALEVTANLSAHMDRDFGETLAAITSGYAGNTDALRNMAYNINQAQIESKALEMGLVTQGEAVDGAARAQAVHAIVMEQSEGIMDAAQNQAGTFNYQMRRMWASVQDAGAAVAQHMLPVITPLVSGFAGLVEGLKDVNPQFIQIGLVIAGFVAAAGPGMLVIGQLTMLFGGLLTPIGLVAGAIAGLGALFAVNFMGMRDAMSAVIDVLDPLARYFAFTAIEGDHLNDWLTHLPESIRPAVETIGSLVGAVHQLGLVFSSALSGDLEQLELSMSRLPGPLQGVGDALITLAETASGVVTAFREDGLLGALDAIGERIPELASNILGLGAAIVSGLIEALGQADWSGIGDTVWGGITAALSVVGEIGASVLGMAASLVSGIAGAIASVDWGQVASGVWNAISTALTAAGSFVETASVVAGSILSSIADGLVTAAASVAGAAAAVAGWIRDQVATIEWGELGTSILTGLRDALVLAITNVAGVATAIYDWISAGLSGVDWDGLGTSFGESIIGLWGAVSAAGDAAYNWLSDTVEAVDWDGIGASIGDWLNSTWDTMSTGGEGFYNWMQGTIDTTDWDSLGTSIGEWLGSAWENIGPATEQFDEWLRGSIAGAAELGEDLYWRLIGVLENTDWDGLGTAAGEYIVDLIQRMFSNDGAGPTENETQAINDRLTDAFIMVLGAGGKLFIAINQAMLEFFGALTLALLQPLFDWGVDLLTGWYDGFMSAIGDLNATNEELKSAVSGWFIDLKDDVLGFVDDLVGGVVGFFEDLYNRLVGGSIVPDLVTAVTGYFTDLRDDVVGIAEGVRDGVIGFFQDLYDGVTGLALDLYEYVRDRVIDLQDSLFTTWESIYTTASDTWDDLYGTVTGWAGDVRDEVDTIITTLQGTLETIWSGVFSFAEDTWNDLFTTVTGIAGDVRDEVTDIIETARDWMNNAWDDAYSYATGVWDDLLGFIEGGYDAMVAALSAPFNWFRDNIGGIVAQAGTYILTPLHAVINGLNRLGDAIVDALSWIGGELEVGWLSDLEWSPVGQGFPARVQDPTVSGMGGGGPTGAGAVGSPSPEDLRMMMLGPEGPLEDHALGMGGIWERFKSAPGDAVDFARDLPGDAWDWIRGGVDSMLGAMLDRFPFSLDFPGVLAGAGDAIVDIVQDAIRGLISNIFTEAETGQEELQASLMPGLMLGTSYTGPISGNWINPVPGSVLTQGSYGSFSHSSMPAVDLAAARGTSIFSPAAGTVMFVGQNGWSGGTGRTGMIDHGGGMVTLYGHVSQFAPVGTQLSQGAWAGAVGAPEIDGGFGYGAHVHMEMFRNGIRVPPESYMRFHQGGILPEDIIGVGGSGTAYALQGGERVIARGGNGAGAGANATDVAAANPELDEGAQVVFDTLRSALELARTMAVGSARLPAPGFISDLKFWAEHAVTSLGDTIAYLDYARDEDFLTRTNEGSSTISSVFSALQSALDFGRDMGGGIRLPAQTFTSDLKFYAEHAVLSIGDTIAYLDTVRDEDFLTRANDGASAISGVFAALTDAYAFADTASAMPRPDTRRDVLTDLKFYAEHALSSIGDTIAHLDTVRQGGFIERAESGSTAISAVFGALTSALDFGRHAADGAVAVVNRNTITQLKFAAEHALTSIGDTIAYLDHVRAAGFVERAEAGAAAFTSVFSALTSALDFGRHIAAGESYRLSERVISDLKFYAEHAVLSIGDTIAYLDHIRSAGFVARAQEGAGAIGQVMSSLTAAFDFAEHTQGMRPTYISYANLTELADFAGQAVIRIGGVIRWIDSIKEDGFVERAASGAQAVGQVMSALTSAFDFAQHTQGMRPTYISYQEISNLRDFAGQAVIRMGDIIRWIDSIRADGFIERAASGAQAVGSVMSALTSAFDFAQHTQGMRPTYISYQEISNLRDFAGQAVIRMGDVIRWIDTIRAEGFIERAAEGAQAVGSVMSALTSAFDFAQHTQGMRPTYISYQELSNLRDFAGQAVIRMGDVIRWIDTIRAEGFIERAGSGAQAFGSVFSALTAAFDFGRHTEGMAPTYVSTSTLRRLSGLAQTAVRYIGDAVRSVERFRTDDYLDRAQAGASAMSAAFGALTSAFDFSAHVAGVVPDRVSTNVLSRLRSLAQTSVVLIGNVVRSIERVRNEEYLARAQAGSSAISAVFGALTSAFDFARHTGGTYPTLLSQTALLQLANFAEMAMVRIGDAIRSVERVREEGYLDRANAGSAAVGSVMQALTSTFDFARYTVGFRPVYMSNVVLTELADFALNAVARLGDAVQQLETLRDDGFIERAQDGAGAVSAVLSSLTAAFDFGGHAGGQRPTLMSNVALTELAEFGATAVTRLGDAIAQLDILRNEGFVARAQDGADAVQSVMGALTSVYQFIQSVDPLTAIPKYAVLTNLRDFAQAAVLHIGDAVENIHALRTDGFLDRLNDAGPAIQAAFTSLGSALSFASDATAAMRGDVDILDATGLVSGLTGFIESAITEFDRAAQMMGGPVLESAQRFAEAASPVLDVANSAINAVGGIVSMQQILPRDQDMFVNNIAALALMFRRAADHIDQINANAGDLEPKLRPIVDAADSVVNMSGQITAGGEGSVAANIAVEVYLNSRLMGAELAPHIVDEIRLRTGT